MTTAQTDQPTDRTPHIYTAIRTVMDKVRGVPKAGEMVLGKGVNAKVEYKFQRYDDMAAMVGAAFRDHGVMLQARVVELKVDTWDKSRDGGHQRWCRVVLRKVFTFTSLVDGSTLEIESCGEGTASDDKATNKAETGAIKNAFKQAFVLATGEEDPDDTRPDDTGQPVVVNDPWQQAERAVAGATQPQGQALTFTRDQQEKAYKALAAIPQCATTGDLNKLAQWAKGWDLMHVPVDGMALGARLMAAKGTLPAGPPRGEMAGDRDE